MDVSRSSAVVNAIAAAHTPAEIGTLLVRVAHAFGFSSVFGGLVPRAGTTKRQIAPLTLVQHVPEDWARRCNARGYLFRDPVFHRLQADPQPFSWSESYASCASELDRKLVGGEAAAFGLTDGFVVPVKTLESESQLSPLVVVAPPSIRTRPPSSRSLRTGRPGASSSCTPQVTVPTRT